MNEFKKILGTVQALTIWSQLTSFLSASFSIGAIVSIMTGQQLIFCICFGAVLSLIFETGIRKLYPTLIRVLAFSDRQKEQTIDNIDRTLIGIVSFLVLFCIVFTVFCSVYAVPYLSQYLKGQISPIWAMFLSIIAVSSTLVTLLGLTYEEAVAKKEKILRGVEKKGLNDMELLKNNLEGWQSDYEKLSATNKEMEIALLENERYTTDLEVRNALLINEGEELRQANELLNAQIKSVLNQASQKSSAKNELVNQVREELKRAKEVSNNYQVKAASLQVKVNRLEKEAQEEKDRQKEVKAVVSFPKRVTPTVRTKTVKTPKNKAVQGTDIIAKLKDRTKKQYKRMFDLSTSEKSRQSNSDKFDLSRKECIESGLIVTTNDKDKTILITKK